MKNKNVIPVCIERPRKKSYLVITSREEGYIVYAYVTGVRVVYITRTAYVMCLSMRKNTLAYRLSKRKKKGKRYEMKDCGFLYTLCIRLVEQVQLCHSF